MKFPFQLPDTTDFDVVGFGTNAIDHLIQVTEYPQFDSKVKYEHHAVEPGGEVATTLVGLQRLGLRTGYAGRFGDDLEGEIGLQSLVSEGVDTGFAERIDGAVTQKAFIIIDKATGERTILWHRDDKLAYKADAAPVAAARRGKVLHMTAHDTAACVRMAAIAKEHGAVVSLDVDNVHPGLDELLPLTDVLITSEQFPTAVTGLVRSDALHALQERYGCPVIGATLGRTGSIFLCNGELIETRAFEVPGGCIDTTGAGDAFRTGFLFGLITGKTIEESALTANAVAALKCRIFGARAGLPGLKELVKFTKSWT